MFEYFNFKKHPVHKDYTVYTFYEQQKADFFETLLVKKRINFQKDADKTEALEKYLFAIHNNDRDEVQELNIEAHKKFKQPFIPDKIVRVVILSLFFVMLIFACIGYFIKNG